MRPPRGPVFLERQGYRRRRLADAARLLPAVGLVVFLLPLLWATGAGPGTGRGGLYLFSVWAVLIAAAALLSRPLSRAAAEEDDAPPPRTREAEEARGP